MSRAGPKSGNYLHLVVLAILQQQAPLAQRSTTLQALPYTPKPSTLRSTARVVRADRTFTLQCLSWNAGGLTSDVFQEFVAWVEAQGR